MPFNFQQIQIIIALDVALLNEDDYWVKSFYQIIYLTNFMFGKTYLAVTGNKAAKSVNVFFVRN